MGVSLAAQKSPQGRCTDSLAEGEKRLDGACSRSLESIEFSKKLEIIAFGDGLASGKLKALAMLGKHVGLTSHHQEPVPLAGGP